jgi:hypothetical protein
MLRFVLDTNVVLDLFHWANVPTPCRSWPRSRGGQVIECLADAGTLDELQRVLTYPQLGLTPEMAVDRYRRYSGLVRRSFPTARRRRCRAARTATTRSFSSSPPVAGPTSWSPRTRRCSGCAAGRRSASGY